MPDDPTLFDEWHLVWTLVPTAATPDADRLHAGLNAPAVSAAVEQAVRRVVRGTPALRPLSVTVTR